MPPTSSPSILTVAGQHPRIPDSVFVADGARIIGAATLSEGASVWYNAVIRADLAEIEIGTGSNIQDNATIHADPDFPAVIGPEVSIGHGAVIHGATVHRGCLVGMGAVIMNGAEIGEESIVAAGALVPENRSFPARSLIAGVPGKAIRELTDAEAASILENARVYRELSIAHASMHD